MITKIYNTYHITQKITIYTASSLRFSRPRGETNEKKRFSEAIFWFNTLYFIRLTPIFLAAIFLRFAEIKDFFTLKYK